MTDPRTPAQRAATYRARRRGGPPRTISDTPIDRARRKIRGGARIGDLDPAEADALRTYQRDRKANR